jgi:hypothetical protein
VRQELEKQVLRAKQVFRGKPVQEFKEKLAFRVFKEIQGYVA